VSGKRTERENERAQENSSFAFIKQAETHTHTLSSRLHAIPLFPLAGRKGTKERREKERKEGRKEGRKEENHHILLQCSFNHHISSQLTSLKVLSFTIYLISRNVNESPQTRVQLGTLQQNMRSIDVVLGELEGIPEGVINVSLRKEGRKEGRGEGRKEEGKELV
jgi:hypothetical protein